MATLLIVLIGLKFTAVIRLSVDMQHDYLSVLKQTSYITARQLQDLELLCMDLHHLLVMATLQGCSLYQFQVQKPLSINQWNLPLTGLMYLSSLLGHPGDISIMLGPIQISYLTRVSSILWCP